MTLTQRHLTATVDGVGDLLRELEKLKISVRRKHAARAVQSGAKPVKAAIEQAAPQDSGVLRKSIRSRLKRFADSGLAEAWIGPKSQRVYLALANARSKKQGTWVKVTRANRNRGIYQHTRHVRDPAKYAHLVEFGRGTVRAKKGKALYLRAFDKMAKSVQAARPRPFVAPAWQKSKHTAYQRIVAALEKAIAQETR